MSQWPNVSAFKQNTIARTGNTQERALMIKLLSEVRRGSLLRF